MALRFSPVGLCVLLAAHWSFIPDMAPAAESNSHAERAAGEVAAYYKNQETKPAFAAAVAALTGEDAAKDKEAAAYLLTLLKQLLSDEEHGRAPVKQIMDFGRSTENAADKLIGEIADALNGTAEGGAKGDAAVELAPWLREHAGRAGEFAAYNIIDRTHTPKADAALLGYLDPPHPFALTLAGAIEEAARRKLPIEPLLRKLALSPRAKVRVAAVSAARDLHYADLPVYEDRTVLPDWLGKLLGEIAAMVPHAVPEKATWVHLKSGPQPGSKDPASEQSGWLLRTDKDEQTVLNYFGQKVCCVPGEWKEGRSFPEADQVMEYVKVAPQKWQQDVRRFGALRKSRDAEKMGALSAGGSITAQFESGAITLPEALVAAWSFQRGERAVAASILLPRLEAMDDDRALGEEVRELLGKQIHHRMLENFSSRDYPEALRLARHLAQPIFGGYQYQLRARRLADQLGQHGDDFKTFVLPAPDQWEEMKKKLDRPAQIRFLAEHLRLLNCWQHGQPGDVDYEEKQYAQPGGEDAAGNHEVINPYHELHELGLAPGELTTIIPYMASRDYMPMFSYWRDFTPNRMLHQVSWAVANVIDSVARRKLSDVDRFDLMEEPERAEHLAKLQEWARANSHRTRADLMVEVLQSTNDWTEFIRNTSEAMRAKSIEAQKIVLHRFTEFEPSRRQDAAEICARLPSPELLAAARQWIKRDEAGVRFWGGVVLLQQGTPEEKDAAVLVLEPILAKDNGMRRYPQAFPALLSSDNEKAMKLACGVLKLQLPPPFTEPMIRSLFLRGREEVRQFVVDQLSSAKPAGSTDITVGAQTKQVELTLADQAAEMLDEWRGGERLYQLAFKPNERAAARAKLQSWMEEQFALIKAGQKSAIADPRPLTIMGRMDEEP